MLQYLDNYQNFRPGFIRQSQTFGPNENFAREILELHTVGPDAGQTLHDIQEVARAFTGWTTPWVLQRGSDGFEYLHDGHDTGAKLVMGELSIPAGGGMSDGEAVIDYLARHPATARTVARKLCQRFISEDPPASLVQRIAQLYLDTDGDLREVTRGVLLAPEFLESRHIRIKTKRPLHFVASVGRAVGVVNDDAFARQAVNEVRAMGEELYGAAPPTGYPERSVAWAGEGPFVFRLNLAAAASRQEFGFGPPPSATGSTMEALVADLEQKLRIGGIPTTTRTAVATMIQGMAQADRIPQATAVLLATPQFLTH
jgi:uncharacterized protein (DUF1800 family)